MIHLETERMMLRRFAAEDESDFHAIFSDPVVMTFVEPAYTPEQTREFLNSFCIQREPPGAYAAVLKSENRVIGYVLYKEMEADVYELGWIFNRDYWHQGYASEICQALVHYAFTVHGARRLCAETAEGPASIAMMRKLGFRHEGTLRQHCQLNDGSLRDLLWYGLLKDEYNDSSVTVTGRM